MPRALSLRSHRSLIATTLLLTAATAAHAQSVVVTTAPAQCTWGAACVVQPVVELRDAGGVRVPGATTAITATVPGGASFVVGTATVDAVDGVATWTDLGTTKTGGLVTSFIFSAPGYTSATVAITPTAINLAVVTAPAGITYGAPLVTQPVVEAQDPNRGNARMSIGGTVAATTSFGVGQLTGTTTVAMVNGRATWTDLAITTQLAANERLRFTHQQAGVNVTTASLSGSAQWPQLVFQQNAAGITIRQPFVTQPIVKLADPNRGNAAVTSFTGTVTIATRFGSGGLTGTTTVNAVAGVATFTDLRLTSEILAGSEVFQVTTSEAGHGALFSSPFALHYPNLVLQRDISGITFGTSAATQPIVEVRDPNRGNAIIADYTEPVTLVRWNVVAPSGMTTVNAVGGIATFTDVGYPTYFAPSSERLKVQAENANAQVLGGLLAGTLPTMAFRTAIAGLARGYPFVQQPVVELRDPNRGGALMDYNGPVTATLLDAGSLQGTTTVAAVGGVATFGDLGLATGSPARIRFGPTDENVELRTGLLTAGDPTLAITTQPSGAVTGLALTTQPVVEVRTTDGYRLTSATPDITATVASGGGALSGTTTITAAAGRGTFTNLAITNAAGGAHQLRFSAPTLAGAPTVTSNAFTVTVPLSLALGSATTSGTAIAGTGPGAAEAVSVTLGGTGSGAQAWTAAVTGPPAPWINFTTGSGTGSGTLRFTRSAAALTAGTYTATIRVTAGTETAELTDTYTVTEPLALAVNPATTSATAIAGDTTPRTDDLTVTLTGTGHATQAWTATILGAPAWASLETPSGTGSGTVRLVRHAGALAAGTYSATIRVTAGTITRDVTETFTVTPPLALAISPTHAGATAIQGATATSSVTPTVTLTGTGNATQAWTAAIVGGAGAAPWLNLMTASGTGSGTAAYTRGPSGLAVGTYVARIRITAGALTADVLDTLTITPPLALAVAPAATNASAIAGTNAPVAQSVTVTLSGTGAGAQAWTAAMVGGAPAWLALSNASGTGSGSFTITRSAETLAPGIFTATIRVTAGALTQDLTETFTVTPPLALAVSPTHASSSAIEGSTTTSSQSATVTLTGTGHAAQAWSAALAAPASWITLTTAGGTGSGALAYTRDATGLGVGTHVATIRVTAGVHTAEVRDTLTITPPLALALSTATTSATAVTGTSDARTATADVTLSGTGAASTAWTAAIVGGAGTAPWLTLTTASGTGSGTLRLARSAVGLAVGTYTATVRVTAGALMRDLTDTFIVTDALALAVAPGSTTASAIAGSAAPVAQTVTVTLAGTGHAAQPWTAAVVGAAPAWLTLGSASGTGSGSFTVTRSAASLAAGVYSATVRITAGALTQEVVETFTVTPPLALAVAPGTTSASLIAGATSPARSTIAVTLTGTGAEAQGWTVAPVGPAPSWLTIEGGSGTSSGTFALARSAVGLAVGRYTATLRVTAGTLSRDIAETFDVTEALALSVAPTATSASTPIGTSTPLAEAVDVQLAGTGAAAAAWTATVVGAAPWVTLTAASGTGSGTLRFTRSAVGLAVGTHTATIRITSGALAVEVTDALTITAPIALTVAPTATSATAYAGSTAPVAGTAAVTLEGPTAAAQPWTAAIVGGAGAAPWLTLTTASGTGSGAVAFRRMPGSLPIGRRIATIEVTAATPSGPRTARLTDTLVIIRRPVPLSLALDRTTASATVVAGDTIQLADSVGVLLAGDGSGTVRWRATTTNTLLQLQTAEGTGSGRLRFTMSGRAALSATRQAPEVVTATIAVSVPSEPTLVERQVTVQLTVLPDPVTLAADTTPRTWGLVEGAAPVRDSVAVTRSSLSGRVVPWTAALLAPWDTMPGVSSVALRAEGDRVVLTVTPGTLPPGSYAAIAVLTCTECREGARERRIPITFTLRAITPAEAASFLMGSTAPTGDQRTILDRAGNRNGTLDLGDVHARVIQARTGP